MNKDEIIYEYEDREKQLISLIRVYNHREKLTLEFHMSYEDGVCMARFSRLIFGHLTAKGYLRLEPSNNNWLPYGKWKRFDHNNQVSFSVKYDTDGNVIEREYHDEPGDEEIEIPDLSLYIPNQIQFSSDS